jgi:hypothetical protein
MNPNFSRTTSNEDADRGGEMAAQAVDGAMERGTVQWHALEILPEEQRAREE